MAACGVVLAITTVATAQTFVPVPLAPGLPENTVRQLSRDGQTVVGTVAESSGFSIRATRWTRGGTLEVIGATAGYAATGRGVIGATSNEFAHETYASDFSRATVLRTNAQTTIITPFENVNAISGDGSTIVGYNGFSPNNTAVRWTPTVGVQQFGVLQGVPIPGGWNQMFEANAANVDGSVIVGSARVQLDTQAPFPTIQILPWRWDAVNGARLLTNANGSTNLNGASATDMTPDATWITGITSNGFYRWREATGFQLLTALVGIDIGERPRIADDGATIVWGRNFWTESSGVRTLQQVLTEAGCDFTGWTNLSAVDISGDGRTIAGNGTNPQGQQQGWVATVPGPGGVVVVGVAGVVVMRRRRRCVLAGRRRFA